MKKILLVLFSLWLGISSVEAQRVYKSSGGKSSRSKSKNRSNGKSEEKLFSKENMIVGGNLGFNFGGSGYSGDASYLYFELNPQVGFAMTDWLHSGVSLGYQYIRYKFYDYYNPVTGQSYDYKLQMPNYYLGVWNKVFLFKQIFFSAEFQYTFYKYANSIDVNTGEYLRQNGSGPSVLLGAGYAGRMSKTSRNYYAFWLNYDILQHPNSPYYSNHDLALGLFYKAGFYFGL